MSTTIISFGASEFQMRFKQPFLTQGINRKKAVDTPAGIYRGFRLETNASPLTVTVAADPTTQDHALVFVTSSGEAVSLKRQGGDFTLDLTPFASKTVVLAVVADYTLGKETTAEIRAFELVPTDEFTGAGDELVVLGTVVVPAAGAIAQTSITPLYRTEAWENASDGAIQWAPVAKNPSFESARTGALAPPDTRLADFWEFAASDGFLWEVEEGNANKGVRSVKLTSPAVLSTITSGAVTQYFNVPTDTNRFYRFRLSFFLLVAPTAGTANLVFTFRDKNGAIATDTVSIDVSAADVSYRQLEETRRVPSVGANNAAYLQSVSLVLTSVAWNPSGDVLRIDDLEVWAETEGVDDPYPFDSALGRERHANPLVFRAKDESVDPWDGIKMEFDPTGDEGTLEIGRVNPTLQSHAYTAALAVRGRLSDLGSELLGDSTAAGRPRISAPFQGSAGVATYTAILASEDINGSKSGSRWYVEEDGNLTLTFNAGWNPATSQWEQDDSAESSLKLSFEDEEFRLQYKNDAAAPWSEGAWDNVLMSFQDDDTLELLDALLTLDATFTELDFDSGAFNVDTFVNRHVTMFNGGVEFDEVDEAIRAYGNFSWEGVLNQFLLDGGSLLVVDGGLGLLQFDAGAFRVESGTLETEINFADVVFDSINGLFTAFGGNLRYDAATDIFRVFGTTQAAAALWLDNANHIFTLWDGGTDGLEFDDAGTFAALSDGAVPNAGFIVDTGNVYATPTVSWLGSYIYRHAGAFHQNTLFDGLSGTKLLEVGNGGSEGIVTSETGQFDTMEKITGVVTVRYRPVEFRPLVSSGEPQAADMRDQWSVSGTWKVTDGGSDQWGVFGLDLGRLPTAVRFRGRFNQPGGAAAATYRVLLGTRNDPDEFGQFTFDMDGVSASIEFDFAIGPYTFDPDGGVGTTQDERNWIMCVELSSAGADFLEVEEIALDVEYDNWNDAIGEAGARY